MTDNNQPYPSTPLPTVALGRVLAFWALVQLALMLKMAIVGGWTLPVVAVRCAVSVASVMAFFALWYLVASYFSPRWGRWLTRILAGGYIALWVYHWTRLEPLTFLLLVKNTGNLASPEAVGFVFSSLSLSDWLGSAVLVFAAIGLSFRYRLLTAPLPYRLGGHWVAALAVANLLLAVPFSTARNEYVELAGSVYQYLSPAEAVSGSDSPYPYLVKSDGAETRAERRPHVFIVMLESFSGYYIDREENGRAVTPFFNRLKEQGLYAEHFFSASVETSKGQFATLCSVYPSYKTNIFTSYPTNNFRCLSEILGEAGYTNVFMKAYHTLDFENTGEFVANNDFDYAHAMDDDFVTDDERERYKIGWGIQDDVFYEKTFGYLDRLHRQESDDARFFVTTMSVTNHMMFDDIPPGKRHIHPEPDSHRDNYANSMYLTDQYLERFFQMLEARDYLDDSLVIVLGDNGFPMGQHGNYHNTKTVYNELFKTPLLVWWPGQVEPGRLESVARSQLDVAPTVTDLLGIETEHHFVGQSILERPEESYFVPMIQPFDGTFLASTRYPYKYVEHLKTGERALFNLADDPGEADNLFEGKVPLPPKQVKRFEQDIQRIKHNEALLKEDRIYPGGAFDNIRVQLASKRLHRGEPLVFEVLGELDEHARVVLRIDPYGRDDSYGYQNERAARDFSDGRVPPEHLQSGINRVVFEVYARGGLRSRFARDVYVDSERVDLVTEMPVNGSQGWGKLHYDRSVRGGPLRVDGRIFGFGLGTHAVSNHTVPLGQKYQSLYVGFGLDDESTCGSGAVFRIYADERKLYESPRLKNGEFAETTVDVSGHHVLRLQTHTAGGGACDHTNWLNPVLYRTDGPAQLSARSD